MDAACHGADPDELFADSTGQNRAKAVCTGCPVRTECLADALDNRVEWGVWGGMTERERWTLLRRKPHVGPSADGVALDEAQDERGGARPRHR
ncbi:WhiB family transcriptional regulator [Streptomyces sp. ISL-10]|nr:WhiB family transcriptional regulator [Streptomyces sp. ISL-10]MBT2368874.1 WhiB family transcriptional regulator [Streptomyces sp. ISL-10]